MVSCAAAVRFTSGTADSVSRACGAPHAVDRLVAGGAVAERTRELVGRTLLVVRQNLMVSGSSQDLPISDKFQALLPPERDYWYLVHPPDAYFLRWSYRKL